MKKVYLANPNGGYDIYISPEALVEKLLKGQKMIDHKIVGFAEEASGKRRQIPVDKAVVAVLHPSLWSTDLIRVDGKPVSKTCTVFGSVIEAGVPGRATTVDHRRFAARMTPGRLYIVTVIDRVDIRDSRENIELVWEYGDSHGGKYVGIWKPAESGPFKLKLETWAYKHRDKKTFVIRGCGIEWEDVSAEEEMAELPVI